ncbi:escargot-like protein, partial [Sarcoptes scabiei]
IDLSIKSLLKESNQSCQSNFVSSYPYPAKFAKIADFLRINESNRDASIKSPTISGGRLTSPSKSSTLTGSTVINSKIEIDSLKSNQSVHSISSPSSPSSISSYEAVNYSVPANIDDSLHHHQPQPTMRSYQQRMSPYSINWSEHFSINRVVVSSPNSSRSDDSGRDSHQSSDDLDRMEVEHQSSITMNANNKNNKKSDRFHCPDCNKSYSTQSGLAKHQEFLCANQIKKSFCCKHCEKVYVSLGALKMHIRTHTLPCKCKLCGKAFSRPWLLQGHIRTHTGEKPFACQLCNRAFADRSNLRAHLQTHSVIKKYSCKNCSRTFSRMSLLLKHEDNGCCSNRQSNKATIDAATIANTDNSSTNYPLTLISMQA